MNELEDCVLPTSMSGHNPGLVQMDSDSPVGSQYWYSLTAPIHFSNTEDRMDVQSTQTVPAQTIRSCKISREQWDQVKHNIHEQYIVKDCTLDELVLHMKKELFFVAR